MPAKTWIKHVQQHEVEKGGNYWKEQINKKKPEGRLMKLKLIKLYVSEVVERWRSLPKKRFLSGWITQHEFQQISQN